MAAVKGQPIIYRTDSDGYHYGFIAGNISGDTADLVVYSNGNEWEDYGSPASSPAIVYFGVDKGTGLGEWQDNTTIFYPTEPAISESAPTRVLGTTYQNSSGRRMRVSFTGRVDCTSTLLGAQAGRIELRSDSSNPPTTVRAQVANRLSGVAATSSHEAPLTYQVPDGHYYSVVAVTESGTPTASITIQSEELL